MGARNAYGCLWLCLRLLMVACLGSAGNRHGIGCVNGLRSRSMFTSYRQRVRCYR